MRVKAEAEAFRRIPLFAECDGAQLQVIAFASERAEFAPGQAIIKQGQKGEAAYLILSGTARVDRQEKGKATLVTTVEAGAFVGELGMIAGLPYSVSVTAQTQIGAARVRRDLFMRVVSEFPEFGARVHAALARKLDASIGELNAVKTAFDKARSFANR
jgi:CRP/FNR family transcriptional regulator, cyclic AMP receptor protein